MGDKRKLAFLRDSKPVPVTTLFPIPKPVKLSRLYPNRFKSLGSGGGYINNSSITVASPVIDPPVPSFTFSGPSSSGTSNNTSPGPIVITSGDLTKSFLLTNTTDDTTYSTLSWSVVNATNGYNEPIGNGQTFRFFPRSGSLDAIVVYNITLTAFYRGTQGTAYLQLLYTILSSTLITVSNLSLAHGIRNGNSTLDNAPRLRTNDTFTAVNAIGYTTGNNAPVYLYVYVNPPVSTPVLTFTKSGGNSGQYRIQSVNSFITSNPFVSTLTGLNTPSLSGLIFSIGWNRVGLTFSTFNQTQNQQFGTFSCTWKDGCLTRFFSPRATLYQLNPVSVAPSFPFTGASVDGCALNGYTEFRVPFSKSIRVFTLPRTIQMIFQGRLKTLRPDGTFKIHRGSSVSSDSFFIHTQLVEGSDFTVLSNGDALIKTDKELAGNLSTQFSYIFFFMFIEDPTIV